MIKHSMTQKKYRNRNKSKGFDRSSSSKSDRNPKTQPSIDSQALELGIENFKEEAIARLLSCGIKLPDRSYAFDLSFKLSPGYFELFEHFCRRGISVNFSTNEAIADEIRKLFNLGVIKSDDIEESIREFFGEKDSDFR